MALSNYTELQTAISDWMERNDISGTVTDCISLAESMLNRELEILEVDGTITGVSGSREIDVASLSVREPVALYLNSTSAGEYEISKRSAGTFPYYDNSGYPSLWSMDADTIKFDVPLSSAYSFRFRYAPQFALSDANPTNWLLTHHPDVYLSAAIAWGAKFVADDTLLQRFAGPIDQFIMSINRQYSKRNKAMLGVDPALASIKRNWWGYNQW